MSEIDDATQALSRFEDAYVLTVIMLFASIVVYAFTGDDRFGQLLTVAVQGATFLVILDASHAPRIAVVVARLVVALAFAAIIASTAVKDNGSPLSVALVGALLAVVGPFAIIRRIMARPRIDVMTVAGALSVYLLAGLFFAYVFSIMNQVNGGGFFVQPGTHTAIDFVYFSFVTMTTVGYGDLTSALDLGRMLAVFEALFGQLYLVAVVAVLISNIGQERTPRTKGDTA